MQSPSQPAASTSSTPEPSSFAGFLSALTSPASASCNSSPNRDEISDDVVTLSYESALKAHSRYKPAPDPLPIPNPIAPDQRETSPQELRRQAAEPKLHQPSLATGDPKSASITIRMSHSECAQLKQRATEAGMTISAYLRSCIFEAETLRSQVKEALAQLRAAAGASEKQPAAAAEQHKRFSWLSRVLPRSSVRNSREMN